MSEDPSVAAWREATTVTTERALACVTSARTDPAVAADHDELRYRIKTAAKYAEALICDCRTEQLDQRQRNERVRVVCDRCQLLAILTGSPA